MTLFGETGEDIEFLKGLDPKMMAVMRSAQHHGVLEPIRELYLVALRHGLYSIPYFRKNDQPMLSITLYGIHPDYLLRVRAQGVQGAIQIMMDPRTFEAHFDITANYVMKFMGDAYQSIPIKAMLEFIKRFDILLSEIDLRPTASGSFSDLPLFNEALADISTVAVDESEEFNAQPQTLREGEIIDVLQTKHERNPELRKRCITRYGYRCVVCDFNFEEQYGALGKVFIHVHHLKPISGFDGEHDVDPGADLRPVCPNCHAMLHRGNPPLSIEQVRAQVKRKYPY